MLIAGFQKTSFVDYPGKICAVVFAPYCNMNCTYCHNRHIISGEVPIVDEADVLSYLDRRRDMLDAVVITGGEPLLRPNLPEFIDTVRDMGYLIKLDTNGTSPKLLSRLISEGKLDYIAMDIKAPLGRYSCVTQVKDNMDDIRKSITIIKNSGVDYEFRTTFAPQLSVSDIEQIAQEIKGARRYYIQQYRKVVPGDPEPHLPSEVRQAGDIAREILGFCEVRGL